MMAELDLRSWGSMFPRMIHNHYIRQLVQEDDLSTIGLEAMRRSQRVTCLFHSCLHVINEPRPLRDRLRQPELDAIE